MTKINLYAFTVRRLWSNYPYPLDKFAQQTTSSEPMAMITEEFPSEPPGDVAGFRQLVRALPGLAGRKGLSPFLTGAAPEPPHVEVLSFPRKVPTPVLPGPKPTKED